MKRQTKKDREKSAWQKLKEAFPDKYVLFHLYRERDYILDKSEEIYNWVAYVDYDEKGIDGVWGFWSSDPIDAVNRLIEKVKSLLEEKEDENCYETSE